MRLDDNFLNEISAQAKANERLRMSYDLRTSDKDTSQRILNALELGTVVPIHRHRDTSETVIVIRGSLKEFFYNDKGEFVEEFLLKAGSSCAALQIPMGQWHGIEVLESGTIIFEGKDGAYSPLSEEDMLRVKNNIII